jgi:hypothetical protein
MLGNGPRLFGQTANDKAGDEIGSGVFGRSENESAVCAEQIVPGKDPTESRNRE